MDNILSFYKKSTLSSKTLQLVCLFFLTSCGMESQESDANIISNTNNISSSASLVAFDITERSKVGVETNIELSESVILSDNSDFSLINTPKLKTSQDCQLSFNNKTVSINSDVVNDCIYEYQIKSKNNENNTATGYIRVSFADTYQQNTLPIITKNLNYNDSDTLKIDLESELADYINTEEYSLNDNVTLMGVGSANLTNINEITYTATETTPYVTILYSFVKKDKSDIKLGSITLSVSDSDSSSNIPPIAEDFDYQEVELELNSYSEPIDVSNYISDEDGDELQLVAVTATHAEVSVADETDLYNKKFIFKSDTAGQHQVTYVVSDHNGGYDIGVVNFYVKPDFSLIRTWQDVTPEAIYPDYGQQITFTAPMTKAVADALNVDYNDTYVEAGINNGYNQEVVLLKLEQAENYCSSRNGRLPTRKELSFLFAEEGSLYNGKNNHNWPVSQSYLTSEHYSATSRYSISLQTGNVGTYYSGASSAKGLYVTCILFDNDIIPNYTVTDINVEPFLPQRKLVQSITGTLLDPEGNLAKFTTIDLHIDNRAGLLDKIAAYNAPAHSYLASADHVTDEHRRIGRVTTNAAGKFSFKYVDTSFNKTAIRLHRQYQRIGEVVYNPDNVGYVEFLDSAWKDAYFEDYYQLGNLPDGVDLSKDNGLPLWNGSVEHSGRAAHFNTRSVVAMNPFTRIKIRQDGSNTPNAGVFSLIYQDWILATTYNKYRNYMYGGDTSSGINSNGVINASLEEIERSKMTPGMMWTPKTDPYTTNQIAFIFDFNKANVSVQYNVHEKRDINGDEPNELAVGEIGNLPELKEKEVYIWIFLNKDTCKLEIYASPTSIRPTEPSVSADNITAGATANNSVCQHSVGYFYPIIASQIDYKPDDLTANPAYIESLMIETFSYGDLDYR